MTVLPPGALAFVILTATIAAGQQAPRESDLPFAIDVAPVTARSARAGPDVVLTVVLPLGDAGATEILHLIRSENRAVTWRLAARTKVETSAVQVALAGRPGEESVLVFKSALGGYTLEGPFRWPREPGVKPVESQRRRTLRGRLAIERPAATQILWLSHDGATAWDEWPRCLALPEEWWECVGVPWNESGVVVFSAAGEIRFGVAPASPAAAPSIQQIALRRASWCRLVRLLLATAPAESLDPVSIAAQQVAVSRGARVFDAIDKRISIETLRPGRYWICGPSEAVDAELNIRGRQFADVRVKFDGWQAGPVEVVHDVWVEPPIRLTGRVTDARGRPAPSAHVLVSERVRRPEDERAVPTKPTMKYRLVAETRADAAGEFEVFGLAAQPYEFVAMHETLGRTSTLLTPSGRPIELRLIPSKRVRGRVVRNGQPMSNVLVARVPELAGYVGSSDPLRQMSLSQLTGPDGRFELALPPEGRGELRIGSERAGVRRIPLAPVEQLPSVLDLGDIELQSSITVLVTAPGGEGCQLHAVGPFGQVGLTVVRGAPAADGSQILRLPEPGRWALSLVCGRRELLVQPPMIDVASDLPDQRFEVTVRGR